VDDSTNSKNATNESDEIKIVDLNGTETSFEDTTEEITYEIIVEDDIPEIATGEVDVEDIGE